MSREKVILKKKIEKNPGKVKEFYQKYWKSLEICAFVLWFLNWTDFCICEIP